MKMHSLAARAYQLPMPLRRLPLWCIQRLLKCHGRVYFRCSVGPICCIARDHCIVRMLRSGAHVRHMRCCIASRLEDGKHPRSSNGAFVMTALERSPPLSAYMKSQILFKSWTKAAHAAGRCCTIRKVRRVC